jgi:hypothetical protein
MAQILPRNLPAVPGGTVNADAANIVDTGAGVFRATPQQLVDAGAPINTQMQAEAGAVNTGRMTPLRVKQAIDALGVSQDVLASSTGGEMVGTKQTGSNTKERDAKAKANDIVTVADFDGIDMTGGSNSATGLSNAISDGRSLMIPNGTLKVDSDLTLSMASLHMVGNGDNSVLDFSGGGSLNLKSDPVVLPDLAADIVAGEDTAAFVSAHGLSEGDVFIVWNPADYSFVSSAWNSPTDRYYYRDGRMFRVLEDIDGTSLRFYGVSKRTFAAANVKCYKMTGGPVVLKDFRIVPNSSGDVPISINGHQGIIIDGVTLEKGSLHQGITISRCFDFDVILAKSTTLDATSNNCYPIIVGNSQNGRIRGGSYYSKRHCIALGGDNQTASVPCADILIEGMVLYSRGSAALGSADSHGNCEDIVYSNCVMNSCAGIGGRDITVRGCTIYGAAPSGDTSSRCVYTLEVVGGVYRFENNRFITNRTETGTGFGVVHLGVDRRVENFTLIARGNTVEHRGASTTARLFLLGVGSSAGSYRVDTQIEDLTYLSSVTPFAVLALDGTADISAQSRHSIDRLFGCDGTRLLVASASANYNAPLRLPAVGKSVTVSAASGSNSAIPSAQNLPYIYPRTPQAQASVVSIANVGNRRCNAEVNAASTTTVTPALFTGDNTNWTDTQDRTVNWSASVRDF